MLNQRSLIFLGLGVLFGLAAMFAARNYLNNHTPDAVELATVVTTSRGVTAGATLSATDLVEVQWPAERVPEGAHGSSAVLHDRVVRRALAPGEPIFEGSLLPVGAAGGLLGVISPEHRAVSVKVDAVIGIAGFVKPGARVDVLATMRKANNDPFSKVILQDVRVLAVDDTLEDGNHGDPKVVNVVTVEVDTKQAERLVLAAHEGRLQLALRKQGDEDIVKTQAVRAGDLYGNRVRGKSGPSIQLMRGNSVQHKTL